MVLTPDEILDHDFTKKGSRAYVASEVDVFLDQVNTDYQSVIADREQLVAENAKLKSTVDELEAKREQVNQSIFVAQEAADRLKKEADSEVKKQLTHAQEAATKIISDARAKAESEAIHLAQENAGLVKEQNQLRTEVENFKNSFLKLLSLQSKLLENDELAEAVHHLPMGEVTAQRVAQQENQLETSEMSKDDSEVSETITAPESISEQDGPVVVLPEAEDKTNNK